MQFLAGQTEQEWQVALVAVKFASLALEEVGYSMEEEAVQVE
jgi:hypothetical protein